MRRPSEELQRRYEMRETRGISNADGQGYLYAYVDSDRWKVGMTNEFVRCQVEWDKDCPYPWRIWLPPIRVANRRRAGEFLDASFPPHHISLASRGIGTSFARNGVSSSPANVLSTLYVPQSHFLVHNAACLTYRPTNTYWKIHFFRNMARRLEHDRVSYLFEGCCFMKVRYLLHSRLS